MESSGAGVEPGKIFVGGLSWETTKEGLKSHFEKYGDVADCVIMMDPITKRPRGFGFVTFSDPGSVVEVLKEKDHILDKKKVDPKPATLKNETNASGSSAQASTKKVFVGGISSNTTEDDVRAYFLQYGTITDVDLKYDKTTQRMRGFGFVGFESEDVVEQVVATHFHQLNGKTVEVKKAEPRYATASAEAYRASLQPGAYGQGSNYGGYSGRGGAGGGYSTYPGSYSNYGYAQQQQQPQQQYGYSYGAGAYGGQNAYQYGQTYGTGADRGYYGAQQANTASQQQMNYGQDGSAYGRAAYTATGVENYSGGGHSAGGFQYDTQTAAAAAYQQYPDNQSAGYGRGMTQQQQRGAGSYQAYGSH